jgi:hypothetical protein
MGTLTGIEVKHNRRYGADCVPRLGPLEIAAEIAAPHQNEGPHLAAGLRARTSADRSGARGKNDVPGRERPTGETTRWIPKRPGSGERPLPFPAPRLCARRRRLSRCAPKAGATLTTDASSQKTLYLEGGMGALELSLSDSYRAPGGKPRGVGGLIEKKLTPY